MVYSAFCICTCPFFPLPLPFSSMSLDFLLSLGGSLIAGIMRCYLSVLVLDIMTYPTIPTLSCYYTIVFYRPYCTILRDTTAALLRSNTKKSEDLCSRYYQTCLTFLTCDVCLAICAVQVSGVNGNASTGG